MPLSNYSLGFVFLLCATCMRVFYLRVGQGIRGNVQGNC